MIPLFKVHMPRSVDKPLLDVLHSGYIGQGDKVDEFEFKFGRYIKNPLVVSVNSGTSALTLALRLAGVGPGDEVVTTPMTCSATNLPILSLGARPVFADINRETGLIDPADVARRLTSKTKAVMCVAWGGLPNDIFSLRSTMKRAYPRAIPIIEDAAHAVGAWLDDKPIGSEADFTCYSFQAIKHITTVDGGMIACKSQADYERARLLRWYGISRDNKSLDSRIDEDIEEWGYKFHMNDVAATIGLAQMKDVQEIVETYRRNARHYEREICDCVGKPPIDGSACWLYTLRLPGGDPLNLRLKFKKFMAAREIMVSQVHMRNDYYSVFQKYRPKQELRGVDDFSRRMICIPVHYGLAPADRKAVVQAVNDFAKENNL